MTEFHRRHDIVGVVLVALVLIVVIVLTQPAAAAILDHGAAAASYHSEEPGTVHKHHAQNEANMEELKMTMLVGTSIEDRPVRMKAISGSSPMETALTTTPEQDQQNAIEDMKDIMKLEKEKEKGEGEGEGRGEDDPLMTTFKEMVTQNMTSNINNNTNAVGFRQRVDEFLSIAGIDAVLPLDCGKNPLAPEDPLRVGRVPWVAALGSIEDSRFRYQCIGVVISRHHILTDAECARSPDVNVVLLNVTTAPSSAAVVNYVAGRRVHPRIREESDLLSGNNIGLVELALPVEFNDDVQPACLPGQSEEPDPYAQKNTTTALLFRIEDFGSEREASLFFSSDASYLGSALCYIETKDFSRTRPTTLYNILTKNHFCIIKNFEGLGRSVIMEVDERTGRVKVLGVGAVANAALTVPIAYTHVQPHRFWIELVLRKFRDNASL